MLRKILKMVIPAWFLLAYRRSKERTIQWILDWLRKANEWRPEGRVEIGKYTYGVTRLTIPILTESTKIKIGKFCSVAPGVIFVIGHHDLTRVSTFPFKSCLLKGGMPDDEHLPSETILIGNDVWIGSNALIVASVKIGDGAVVSAGSVVVKDVPPYAVVGGVPAKVIKMRFSEQIIREITELQWWDWPDDRILANLELFYGDADLFIMHNVDRKG